MEEVGIGGLEGGKIKDCVLVKGTGMHCNRLQHLVIDYTLPDLL